MSIDRSYFYKQEEFLGALVSHEDSLIGLGIYLFNLMVFEQGY